MYIIKQATFEGPLDLLLELIEKEKLSITEISLAKVTDDFLVHIKSLGAINPDQLAEFLVVAAQLMLIKSRSLLPSLQLTQEEEGSIEELQRRLKEYKRIKELAKELKKLEAKRERVITREAFFGIEPVFYPPPKLTLLMVQDSFLAFLAALPKLEKLAEEKIRRIVSLEEKIKHIRLFLENSLERAFSDIVKGAKEKVEVIVSFLAILELAKQKFVDLRQNKLFEDITITRTRHEEENNSTEEENFEETPEERGAAEEPADNNQ